MRKFLGPLVLLVVVATARAHPGVGIVQDRRGNVFFTDLKQVWMVAPDGKPSVAVPDVHTHELCLDGDDHLFGEHSWYEGDASKRWGHRVWRRQSDGTVLDVIPARAGSLEGYSFVRDGAGRMYWADRDNATIIKRREPDGTIATHARVDFRVASWMTATPDGTLFVIDGGDLRRIAPDGKVTTVVAKLSGQRPPPAEVSERHYHMGLWTDEKGGVYVAIARERLVLRVQADGQAEVVARSAAPWSPSGGLIDRDGRLWLLEYDPTNAVRARRIDPQGGEQIFDAGGRSARTF